MIQLAGKFWKAAPPFLRAFLARRMHPTFTSSAAGIITNECGEVLLLDHVFRPLSGWGIPGGFLDRGEQADAALRRELVEETGLVITDIELYRVRTIERHIEVVFTAKATGEPRILAREITAARWFAVDAMPVEMSIRQQRMIREALKAEPPGWAGGLADEEIKNPSA
jgi:ADP-ribose pyrophosphatase YjhB (NUDIX family)